VVILDAEGIHGQLCQVPGSTGPHFLLALTASHGAIQDDLIPLPGPKGRGGAWRMVNPQMLLPHAILELRKAGEQLSPRSFCAHSVIIFVTFMAAVQGEAGRIIEQRRGTKLAFSAL